jgi:uncharacterized HAD superfamily protein
MLNFVTWNEFFQDVVAFERSLPQFDAVCGVPRSGLFPATYIATTRNIRLVDYNTLLEQPSRAMDAATDSLRQTNPLVRSNKPVGNRLLVIDDSSSAVSVTMRYTRELLADQTQDLNLEITYAAVYRESEKSKVDLWHKEIAQPRVFEWNWIRNWRMTSAMFDMDGVLCEDWIGNEVIDGVRYKKHLLEAKPLYIPQVPIHAIVTGRLEKYRSETADWLMRHGVAYRYLFMHPAATPQERQRAGDHAARKAEVYTNHPKAIVFVESCLKQSQQIAEATQRPVLCTNGGLSSFAFFRDHA